MKLVLLKSNCCHLKLTSIELKMHKNITQTISYFVSHSKPYTKDRLVSFYVLYSLVHLCIYHMWSCYQCSDHSDHSADTLPADIWAVDRCCHITANRSSLCDTFHFFYLMSMSCASTTAALTEIDLWPSCPFEKTPPNPRPLAYALKKHH